MKRVTGSAQREYVARLTSVEATGDYRVSVTFSDGTTREVDLRGHFVRPDGELLGSPADFAQVRVDVDSDSLLWENGFHEHGEALYDGG